MTPHATTDDLTAWLPEDVTVPSDAARLLERASLVVDDAVTAPYLVDTERVPTETRIADALRDATCAQVEWWIETGDVLGLDDFHSVSIGSVTLARSESKSRRRLAPDAQLILANAGLTGAVVV